MAFHAPGAAEKAPVDDVPSHLDQDAGERRVGDGLNEFPEAQNDVKEASRHEDAGDRGASAGADVGRGRWLLPAAMLPIP
jgi:hypothetical protein